MMTHQKNALSRGRKRGVTLIEAVLFISISLGLIVGGIVFFQQANTSSRTNDVVRNISGLASQIRSLYRSQPNFLGLTNETVANAGFLPATLTFNSGNISNEFGVADGYTFSQGASTDTFYIILKDVPSSVCSRIGGYDAAGQGVVGIGIVSVAVQAGAATDFEEAEGAEGAEEDGAVAPDVVAALCTDATTNDIRIEFDSGI